MILSCTSTLIEEFEIMRRTIVIGDVHGCAEEFETLLRNLKLRTKDRVFQVGDLINRGPDSHKVLKLARSYNVQPVLGNHEVRLLRSKKGKISDHLRNYDHDTLEQLTKEDWKFLKKLPPHISIPKCKTVIVHAGFLPKTPWHKQDIDTITQIRSIDTNGDFIKTDGASETFPWEDIWKGDPFIVYGHNSRPEVFKRPGSIGIDTGCVYGGHLTAYIVEDQSIIQVPAKEKYA